MDKKPDYSFMKSGFNTLNESEPADPEQVLIIASMVSAFAGNALKEAGKYVEHAKRKVIQQEDIKLCMKAETFKFLTRSDTKENVEKWRGIIQEDIAKELNDEEFDDYVSEEEEDELDDTEEFKKSECNCESCNNINSIDESWENWVPQTPMEKILKKAIDDKL